jgi:hypothetical protein
MLPYLAPLIIQTWMLAWMVSAIVRRRAGIMQLVGVAFLAFFSGGFSETAAAFQVGLFGVGLLAAWIAFRAHRPTALAAFRLSWAAALGSLLSLWVLTISHPCTSAWPSWSHATKSA